MTRPPPVVIAPDQLVAYRRAADDQEETDALLAAVHGAEELSLETVDRILRWKLRNQYGRQSHLRAGWTDAEVRACTREVLAMETKDAVATCMMRLRALVDAPSPHKLPGIGMGVASAILALTDPARCCVIDFRGWRTLFGEERREFWFGHYEHYLRGIADVSRALGWTVCETGIAAWAYDKAHFGTGRKGGRCE